MQFNYSCLTGYFATNLFIVNDDTASHSQPAIISTPPIGVIAPNQSGAPSVIAYKLPANIIMPICSSHAVI